MRMERGASPRVQAAITSLHDALAGVHADDDQAKPSWDAARRAEHLLRLLLDHAPPTVSIETDGAIAFDWIATHRRMFSISVSESDKLAYAWLIDDSHGHGTAAADSEELPEPIPTLLKMIESTKG